MVKESRLCVQMFIPYLCTCVRPLLHGSLFYCYLPSCSTQCHTTEPCLDCWPRGPSLYGLCCREESTATLLWRQTVASFLGNVTSVFTSNRKHSNTGVAPECCLFLGNLTSVFTYNRKHSNTGVAPECCLFLGNLTSVFTYNRKHSNTGVAPECSAISPQSLHIAERRKQQSEWELVKHC